MFSVFFIPEGAFALILAYVNQTPVRTKACILMASYIWRRSLALVGGSGGVTCFSVTLVRPHTLVLLRTQTLLILMTVLTPPYARTDEMRDAGTTLPSLLIPLTLFSLTWHIATYIFISCCPRLSLLPVSHLHYPLIISLPFSSSLFRVTHSSFLFFSLCFIT